MTWYGHQLVLLISISKAPAWSPSSPAWHHDLHHRVAIGVVTPTMLLLLLLPLSDKVKHYIALNDWHAGHTIIKDNPMAPAGCRMHRHASRYKLLQTWSSHTSNISHHVFGHIISQHTLQKQVRHPLIVVACFTWLLWVSSKNDSYLRKATTVICKLLFNLLQGPPLSNPIQLRWERQTPASHLYATKSHVCRWNRSHVRGHVRLVRAASSHNTAESK